MRQGICAGVAALFVAAGASAEDERRELDAHEHGHGSLSIAIEKGQLFMELDAPGTDIVGFEHSAESDEDKALIEAAKATLARPQSLFVLPEAAGCTVDVAEVALIGDDESGHDDHGDEDHHDEEHHDDEEHHADEDHHDEHADHDDHDGAGGHTEFHAEYQFACASADELTSIRFAYFENFAGAEELEVGVITEATQALYDVDRNDPVIQLPALR